MLFSGANVPPPVAVSAAAVNISRKRKFMRNGYMNFNYPEEAVLLSGEEESVVRRDSEITCPICFETLNEAAITRCGHTFCLKCVQRAVKVTSRCPKCTTTLSVEEGKDIFPNFVVNELIAKRKAEDATVFLRNRHITHIADLQKTPLASLMDPDSNLSIVQVDQLMKVLNAKRMRLKIESEYSQMVLLREFLTQIKQEKSEEFHKLRRELGVINQDLAAAEGQIKYEERLVSEVGNEVSLAETSQPTIEQKKGIFSHYSDLVDAYFTMRSAHVNFPPGEAGDPVVTQETATVAYSDPIGDSVVPSHPRPVQEPLKTFANSLTQLTR